MAIEIIIAIAITVFILLVASAWYRIVDPSEAHLVITPTSSFIASPDETISPEGVKTYFAVSSWLPWVGRTIRIMDMTIKELVHTQETYEKNQARYNVRSSTKYRITNVKTAAERFISNQDLQEQLKEVISASVRAVTVKYDVVDARANKQKMGEEIQKEMQDDLDKWGLTLINFQLVDFQDTSSSTIISDISKRREVEIHATTRERNAEKLKQARMKEAESEEKAKEREIAKDKVIGQREENKKQAIAEEMKLAEQKRYEVVEVQTIRQAEIDKSKAIVEANQAKEQEKILKEQKQLEGQGDRLKAEEQAKGEAAPILEKGLAEAKAKEALQAALNKFGDEAIRALVAEKVVDMQKEVGIATAEALTEADVKVFAGGGKAGEEGFELGKMIQSMSVSNGTTAEAVLNKIARPNDLGLTALGLSKMKEESEKQTDELSDVEAPWEEPKTEKKGK